MSIIIRLQNLPWSANSMDIRNYFQGLSIPEGGVHIVGGEQGDAFIAFSTDEDARQAMMNDGGKIKDGKIKLLLSSRSEMQKVIEQARQTTLTFQNTLQAPQVTPTPTATPQSNLAPMGIMTQMGLSNSLMAQQAAVGLAQQMPHGAQLLAQNPMQTGPQAQLSAAAPPFQNQTNNLDQQTLAQKDWQGSMPMGLSGPGIPPQAAQLGMPGLMPGMPPHLAMMGMIPGMSAAQFAQMAQMGLLGPNPLANFPALLYAQQQQQQQKQPTVSGVQPTPLNVPSTEAPSSALQMTPNVHPVFSQAPSNQFPPSFNQTPGAPAPSQVPAPPIITPTDRDNVQSDSKDDSDDVRIISEEKDTKRSTKSRSKSRERRKGDRYERRDRDRYDRRRRSRSRSRSRERRRRERREKERKSRRSRSRERTRFSKESTKDGSRMTEDGKNGYEANKSNKEEIIGTNKPFPVPTPNPNPGLVPPVHVPFSNIDTTLKMPDMKTTSLSNNGPKQGPPSWSNSPNMKTPEPNTCIEIRNVPNNVRYVDIKSFFQHYPLYQEGIKIINDKTGKRTGIIYVQFLRGESKERALQDLNGKFFLESQVELLPIEDEIFQKAVDSFRPARNASGQEPPISQLPPIVIFKVLSVPASVTREQIAQIFGDIELETVRVNREDPARTMVFVKIKNENDAQQFTLVRKTHMIDNKPVLVVPCFESEFAEAVKKFPDEPDPIKTDCILIKNLPKHTNDRDVGDLFSDIALSPLKIHMMFTAEGEPSGDVFCEFATPEEANRAVTKNETVFGRNTVSVLLVSRQTLNEALGTPLPAPPKMLPPGMSLLGARPTQNMSEFMNPHFNNSPGPMGNGLGPNGSAPFMGPNGGPMNMGSRPERFPSYDRGRGGMRGRGRGRGGYPGGYDARFFDPGYERSPQNRTLSDQDSDITSPENFGKPGCVLALENIPYRASMDEILGFFRDFELTRDNIIRRYDEDGRPTGDARVCLVSPSEAQRALAQLSRQYIQNRMIHLSLV